MIKLLYYTTTYYLNKISYYYKDEYYSCSPKRDTFQTTPLKRTSNRDTSKKWDKKSAPYCEIHY